MPAVRNEMGTCNSMTHMTLTLEFSDADIDSPQPVTFDVVTTVLKALLFWDIYILHRLSQSTSLPNVSETNVLGWERADHCQQFC